MELKSVKTTQGLNDDLGLNGTVSNAEKEIQNLKHPENDLSALTKFTNWIKSEKQKIYFLRNVLIILLYYGYYGYAMYCHFGDEASLRLTIFTIFGTLLILWHLLKDTVFRRKVIEFIGAVDSSCKFGRRPVFIKWSLYIIVGGAIIAYIVVNVALKEPSKLISLGGLVCFILLLVLLSHNKRKIQWHTVFWGMAFQFGLGLIVLKVPAGRKVVLWFSDRLQELLSYSRASSIFIFGNSYMEHQFAFATLPTIIFFCTVVTVLQYLGVIQAIVQTTGRFLAFCLGVSAPEAMNASANIFLGGGESTVLVLQYLDSSPVSHMFAFLTAGAASCGGAALIQFMSFGVPGNYLLAASVMSAPAALVCSKIMYPDEEEAYHVKDEDLEVKVDLETQKPREDGPKRQPPHVPKSIVEALVMGAKQGLKMIANLTTVLIVFLAVIDLADATVMWFGERIDVHGLTLKFVLSYIFYPFSFLMGVDSEDRLYVGELLGIRTVSVAPVAYRALADTMKNTEQFESYTAIFNNSWTYRGKDIYLEHWDTTLRGGIISERSALIGTYALCGFASITTVGMSLGVVGALAPRRVPEISNVAPWAVISGTIASYLTACVAGLLS